MTMLIPLMAALIAFIAFDRNVIAVRLVPARAARPIAAGVAWPRRDCAPALILATLPSRRGEFPPPRHQP